MRKIDSNTLELMRKVVGVIPKSPLLQETYEIQVVTPMFGGGVNAGENDTTKLIRETSIRGALRFWFRATVGAACKTPEELFAKESAIFGTTDIPSRIKIRVSHIHSQASKSYRDLSPKPSSPLGYALFPFQDANNSGCLSTFNLTLAYPEEYEREIETTLWAWFNFGGIGARTRRGCGALFCKNFAPKREESKVVWSQKFALSTLIGSSKNVRKWTTLGEVFLHPQITDPQKAWSDGIADYKYYRQEPGIARNKKNDGTAGRSFWPEPDAIRQITKKNSPKHRPYTDRPIAFPRAELGAPINFHFKDKSSGDPQDVLICPKEEGRKCDRFCSPIIIKPLVFDDGETAASCVVFLNGPRVKKVVLGKQTQEFDVVDKKNAAYQNSPLKDYSVKGSAFEGFKKFVKVNDYEAIR